MDGFLRTTLIILAIVTGVLGCRSATAQLSLPGATAPAPVGSVVPAEARSVKPRPKPVAAVVASPLETNLGGKALFLNGGKSQMAFTAREKTVDLSRLLLAGTKVSNVGEDCQVDVAGLPLPLSPLGKVDGLLRFSIPIPACPLAFGVLDGAVLVSGEDSTCVFKEADCSVKPSGLWGAPPGDIGPDRVKVIERERTAAERGVRAAYHGLVASTKDRALIRGYASDQAGFSSKREELCRDYIGEARHGFCASRLTEAREAALETTLAGAQTERSLRKSHAAHHQP